MFAINTIYNTTKKKEISSSAIKNISMNGGGIKGAVFSGLVQAMEVADMINGIKRYSGTSAGSNIAAFLSVGMKSCDLNNKVLNLDMSQKLGTGWFGFFNNGKPVVDFVNDLLIETISANIESIEIEDEATQAKFHTLTEKITKAKEDIAKKPRPEEIYKITFGDLALLRKIKPETFKDLYITAVSKQTKALKIFSSENEGSHSISIAEACRASSSLPLLFSPAKVNNEELIDGGLKNNIPFDVFFIDDTKSLSSQASPADQTKESKEDIISKTLVCTLDEGGRSLEKNYIYKTIFGKNAGNFKKNQNGNESNLDNVWHPKPFEKILMMIMRALGLLQRSYVEDANEDYKKLIKHNAILQVLNLDTEGITTTDFSTAHAMGDEKYLKGYFSTIEHFINYEKLNQLDESKYKTLVDRTRLQECFFKIITGAKLDRTSSLYKDLLSFCKNEKFEGCVHTLSTEKTSDVSSWRKELNQAFKAHQEWMNTNEEYQKWESSTDPDKTKKPKDEAWENAKQEYEKSKEAITRYNEELKNVSYLQVVVENFVKTISNSSNEISSNQAKQKLQSSLEAVIQDPYISSQNVKNLFKDVKFVENASAKQIGRL